MARSPRLRRTASLTALGSVVFLASCSQDWDFNRAPPPRGSLGEEMYGVLCDRVGAQALHDDMTGASFTRLCHRGPDGAYENKVDVSKLPEMLPDALDRDGNPVTLETQQATRAHGVARAEAFARRRDDIITALDFAIPDIKVPVTDNKNSDPTKSCLPPAASGEGRLHDELADVLARFQDLYNDGTAPQSTESLARVLNAFRASPDAQAAYARLDARKGYRPIDIALGTTRPMMAYPHLRDLSNATLSLLSADSQPYEPNPKFDDQGKRILVPGAAYTQLTKLLQVAHEELRDVQPEAVLLPLKLPKPVLDESGREFIVRKRTNAELLQELAFAKVRDGLPGSRHIVRRDPNGYASIASLTDDVPAPFVDKDGDHMADVDDLGQFVTIDKSPAPSPFFVMGAAIGKRSKEGFAVDAKEAPIYNYVDTSTTLLASVIEDLKPLVNPDPSAKHETLLYALNGVQVLLGGRDGSNTSMHQYSPDPGQVEDWKLAHPGEPTPAGLGTLPVTVSYNAFHPESSPLVDLVYALGQIMGDKNSDDTLAFAHEMVSNHSSDVARLLGDALYAKTEIADKHPESKIPANSTFWDEMLDVVTQIAQEPGLLEDVLKVFADDKTAELGGILAKYMHFKDHISYDRNNIDAPFNMTTGDKSEMKTPIDRTQPDSGDNRSAFQRFVQTVHDTNGVAACNKDGAIVHARGTALGDLVLPSDSNVIVRLNYGSKQSFKECEVFKIDNLAKFYVQSMAGAANLYFRDNMLRAGFLGIGASTVDVVQKSSGMTGFWDPIDSTKFRPKPNWLNRLVFFDLEHDSPKPGDKNYATNQFINDLQGIHFTGTTLCTERVIDDPVPNAPDALPDKKVHGLRDCKDGDWFVQRDRDAMFVFEDFGFFNAIAPVVGAFATHKREDLFIQMMEVVHKHWQTDKGTASECNMGLDKNKKPETCTKDGASTYEPILTDLLASDIMYALHDLTKLVAGLQIKHCTAADPAGKCTKAEPMNGITLLANSTRAMVDPKLAKEVNLTDRFGNVTAKRNDGTTNPQVTPIYLVLQALQAADEQFEASEASNAGLKRKEQWKMARSQLVDQFLDVNGKNTNKASFKNEALPKILPAVINVIRSQLWAQCPTSFTPPFDRCKWAKDEQTANLVKTMKGPTFAAGVDLIEAIRRDDNARTQLEMLLSYMLDAASSNDALAAVIASAIDGIQVLGDDKNLVPLFHALASAAAPSLVDAKGHIVRKGLLDAQLAFLARVNGRAFDENKNEVCSKELDPNQVLQVALQKLVTPMTAPDGTRIETPLEVIIDVIAEVNRAAPGATDKLRPQDYASIADNVSDFLSNKERGLEQFYEIVRQGTLH
jgi:hypothetical protein